MYVLYMHVYMLTHIRTAHIYRMGAISATRGASRLEPLQLGCRRGRHLFDRCHLWGARHARALGRVKNVYMGRWQAFEVRE